MLVLCTGMVRSGSTWSFNVVKQLLRCTGCTVRSGYTDAVGDALLRHGETDPHVIVKTHWPDKFGRALIKQRGCRTIYTYREPLEAILSLAPADTSEGRLERSAQTVRAALELMRFQLEAGGVRFVWYGDIVERGRDVVQAIADYLGLGLEPHAISEVADALSRDNVRRIIKQLGKSAAPLKVGESNWDGGTLFNDTHIREHPADPASVFSADQVARIAAGLGDHVDSAAMLRPAIRDIGRLDHAAPGQWPPVTPPPEAEPIDAEAPVAEPIEAEPAQAAAEPPEAPPLAAAPAAPPPAAQAAAPTAAAPKATAAAAPSKSPSVKPAAPKPAAPRPPPYDPVRDAARRALARDLMSSLGYLPRGKPRTPLIED